MDEIDAIGGRKFSEGTSADREIQRTLMEVCVAKNDKARLIANFFYSKLLSQMDGFDSLGKTKLIMATNRPDTLDPALLRPGRLDRKIEIPLPNQVGRLEIFKIHAAPIAKSGEIGNPWSIAYVSIFVSYSPQAEDYDAVVRLSDGFNGADIRNVCTEAGSLH